MAVTGIFPRGTHPNSTDELASAGILETYRARLKRWLRSYDDEEHQPREFDAPEPPEEKSLQDKLLEPIEGDDLHRLLAGLPDIGEAEEYVDLIRKARAYVDEQWPKIPMPGVTADVFPLSDADLYDISALVRVLDDPSVLFDEMEAESLTIPMVDAWRSIYAEMAAAVDKMLDELVIERVASKKSLTWQQADLYRMIRGVPLDAVIEFKQDKPKEDASAQQQQKQGEST